MMSIKVLTIQCNRGRARKKGEAMIDRDLICGQASWATANQEPRPARCAIGSRDRPYSSLSIVYSSNCSQVAKVSFRGVFIASKLPVASRERVGEVGRVPRAAKSNFC